MLQGTVMIESFLRFHPNASVRVLAIDLQTKQNLDVYFDNQIEVVNLLENTVLLDLFGTFKQDRTLAESIFTLKVYWINSLLDSVEANTKLIYADADLYFLDKIVDFDFADWSILVSPHLFPKNRELLSSSGLFNAGCIGINVGKESRSILAWWRDKVLEFCGTSTAEGLYADQKYLDSFQSLGRDVRVFRQEGINTGMWQISLSRKLKKIGDNYFIGENPLNSFHFHGLRISRLFIRKGMLRYGVPTGSLFASMSLYRRYARELERVFTSQRELGLSFFGHKLSLKRELLEKLVRPVRFLDLNLLPFGFRKSLIEWKEGSSKIYTRYNSTCEALKDAWGSKFLTFSCHQFRRQLVPKQ
jgi:hypothetical protein